MKLLSKTHFIQEPKPKKEDYDQFDYESFEKHLKDWKERNEPPHHGTGYVE